MKKSTRDLLDFNKQILLGEVGSLIVAPIFGFIASLLITSPTLISGASVLGSLAGGVLFWLFTRIRDEKQKKRYTIKSLLFTILHYTPAALVFALLIYQPVLFFLSKYLLNQHFFVMAAVILAQLVGFVMFVIVINCYRFILSHWTTRHL